MNKFQFGMMIGHLILDRSDVRAWGTSQKHSLASYGVFDPYTLVEYNDYFEHNNSKIEKIFHRIIENLFSRDGNPNHESAVFS